MLRGVVEPINGAVSSPLQNFETSWLPGIRLELQPSLDSSMLSHALVKTSRILCLGIGMGPRDSHVTALRRQFSPCSTLGGGIEVLR